MAIDHEQQISDSIELMEDIEDLIINYNVTYVTALNACAGIHGKVLSDAMSISYGIEDKYEAVAEIVMTELEELSRRVRDRVSTLIKPEEGELLN